MKLAFASCLCLFKIWTPFPQYSGHISYQSFGPPSREHYTGLLDDIMMGAVDETGSDQETVEESERVLAFFDHLIVEERIQRRHHELNSLSSASSSNSLLPPPPSCYFFLFLFKGDSVSEDDEPSYNLEMFLRHRHGDQIAPPPTEYDVELGAVVEESPDPTPSGENSPRNGRGGGEEDSRRGNSHQDDCDFLRSYFRSSSSDNNDTPINNTEPSEQ